MSKPTVVQEYKCLKCGGFGSITVKGICQEKIAEAAEEHHDEKFTGCLHPVIRLIGIPITQRIAMPGIQYTENHGHIKIH